MRDYQESVTTGQTERRNDRQTDRRRTKWSLCATMLRRRHNKNVSLMTTSYYHFKVVIMHTRKLQICQRTRLITLRFYGCKTPWKLSYICKWYKLSKIQHNLYYSTWKLILSIPSPSKQEHMTSHITTDKPSHYFHRNAYLHLALLIKNESNNGF